jgi:hypothetical protein
VDPADGTNSIGRCLLCGYEGPGPEHDCHIDTGPGLLAALAAAREQISAAGETFDARESGDEDTGPLGVSVPRTRTDLESAEIELELADSEQAAAFFERVAAIIRKGGTVRVRVRAA